MQKESTMERWMSVPGWPGYEASNLGNFRRDGRVVKTSINRKRGYRYVMLHNRERRKNAIAHRVVAELFVPGKTSRRIIVNHKDFDKTNNRAENLEWVTLLENSAWSKQHGRMASQQGEESGASKYKNGQIEEIHALKEKGLGPVAISRKLDIPYSTVEHVLLGSRWPHFHKNPKKYANLQEN